MVKPVVLTSDATLVSMQFTIIDPGRLKKKVRDGRAETDEGASRSAREDGKATKTSNWMLGGENKRPFLLLFELFYVIFIKQLFR